MSLRSILPHGLIRWADWRDRFRRVGSNPFAAMGMAASASWRQALVQSRIELLPFRAGCHLTTIVDVGANQGQWSHAIRRFITASQHHVVEPNPECAPALNRLAETNPSIHLHFVAVGNKSSELGLRASQASNFSSLLAPLDTLQTWYGEAAAIYQTIPVAVMPLDDLLDPLPECIDLLKIDVQGFEERVLQGAVQTLSRTRVLLIELNFVHHYEGDALYYELAQTLQRQYGFDLCDIAPPERNANDGRALWTDASFVKKIC